jgi:predicted kinase
MFGVGELHAPTGSESSRMGVSGKLGVMIVVVSGIPGSGKTTLARQLAQRLDWPLLSKDAIKERLMDVLGTRDITWASNLSRTAHHVMYGLVPDLGPSIILEAHFHRGIAENDLRALGMPMVQVFCRCPVDVAWARYQARRDSADRHPGHRPDHQDDEATAAWRNSSPAPLDLDSPLIHVDTTTAVDIDALASTVLTLWQE